jgi:hypothetical protein
MMRRTLFLRVFAGYAAVILVMSAAVYLFSAHLIRTEYTKEKTQELGQLAALLADESLPFLNGVPGGPLEEWAQRAGRRAGVRITVIGRSGQVLADSEKDPVDMENHLYRPEIFPALQGEVRSSVRFSSTLRSDIALPELSHPPRSRSRRRSAGKLLYARPRADHRPAPGGTPAGHRRGHGARPSPGARFHPLSGQTAPGIHRCRREGRRGKLGRQGLASLSRGIQQVRLELQ